ncbi:MAG: glycosyltransferase family 87 protein [Candidatus Pacebacteria bacterium]|nr:glycosyltransferase family 87 protein [Candidatus Paceibacterota bacterium]
MSLFNKKIILLSVISLFIFLFIIFIFISTTDTDIKIYYSYAQSILQNKVPYRDFFVVYPPFSLLPIILPGFFSTNITTYKNLFGLEMLTFLILTIFLLYLLSKRLKKDYFLVILGFLLISIFLSYTIIKRFDIFVTFLIVLSTFLLVKKKYCLSGVLLIFGVFTKFYPIILFPLFFLYIFKKESVKKSLFFVFSSGVTFFIIVLFLFLIMPPQGSGLYSLEYQFTRPLHFESFYGSTLLLLEKTKVPIFKTTLKNDMYGWSLYDSPLLKFILPFSTLFILIMFMLLFYSFEKKGEISDGSLLKYVFSFLLIFMTFNKVLSPQFLIWILPLGLLALNSKEFKILFLVVFLTFFIYPPLYGILIEKQFFALSLLFLRNVLLVLLSFSFLRSLLSPSPKITKNKIPQKSSANTK